MKLISSVAFCCLLLSPLTLFAADIENGKELHSENCLSCHTTAKYTAKTRSIKDLASLEAQIKRCDYSLGTQWFDEDITDVITYLNNDYYKFNAE